MQQYEGFIYGFIYYMWYRNNRHVSEARNTNKKYAEDLLWLNEKYYIIVYHVTINILVSVKFIKLQVGSSNFK